MKVTNEGSVRVDLLGGTLDLDPIGAILPSAFTLNAATSLRAKVVLEESERDGVEICSQDYGEKTFFPSSEWEKEQISETVFGKFTFIALIVHFFKRTQHLKITLESGSPPGAGLGGSSAMGITLFNALSKYTQRSFSREKALSIVKNMEAKILGKGPTGYQDYYPALYGGVLALHPSFEGVEVEQLYSKELALALEEKMTLVFSGQARLSGINNWEVYKSFFDGDKKVRKGLEEIAELSKNAYMAIKNKNFLELFDLMAREGEKRIKLFPGICPPEMSKFFKGLSERYEGIGQKICGAGGGGCFLLIHQKNDTKAIHQAVLETGRMNTMVFNIVPPLEGPLK